MAGSSSPSASPNSKSRRGGIRKFVRRVASFASGRSNGRESKTAAEAKTSSEAAHEQDTPPRSSPPRSLKSQSEAVADALPPPPVIAKSLSSSSSATATSETKQPSQPNPGRDARDTDATSFRSAEFSEESSFSGISALPSDYGQSVTSSPEQVLGQLSRSSLYVLTSVRRALCLTTGFRRLPQRAASLVHRGSRCRKCCSCPG